MLAFDGGLLQAAGVLNWNSYSQRLGSEAPTNSFVIPQRNLTCKRNERYENTDFPNPNRALTGLYTVCSVKRRNGKHCPSQTIFLGVFFHSLLLICLVHSNNFDLFQTSLQHINYPHRFPSGPKYCKETQNSHCKFLRAEITNYEAQMIFATTISRLLLNSLPIGTHPKFVSEPPLLLLWEAFSNGHILYTYSLSVYS